MPETIFYLEGRGQQYLYHFIVYNLGGLYYILNNIYNVRGHPNTSCLLEDGSKIVSTPSNPITFPIKIHMKDIIPFHREAFEIIKDKFTLIEELPTDSDYEIVSIYGETCVNDGLSDNPTVIFPFLRNLFLNNISNMNTKKKRIFITRKNSESYHSGILKRHMWNENELMNMLHKYNFEYIQLEEYPFEDKIKLFMDSEIIISSYSSALTNLLFVDKNTKIIEISRDTGNQFLLISNIFGLNFNRYSDIINDANQNYTLDIIKFEKFLLENIMIQG